MMKGPLDRMPSDWRLAHPFLQGALKAQADYILRLERRIDKLEGRV